MWTPAHFVQLVLHVREGAFAPVIAQTFPLTEIAAAQREFELKRFVGKFVLTAPTSTGG